MKIKLCNIEMDTTIQCRTHIDMACVNEYAERMTEGDIFPPVVLYGTKEQAWIADGWTRIMAAQSVGFEDIDAEIREGGRRDALKAALGANITNGQRRKREDVTRVIELAIAEFGKMSDVQLGTICGVAPNTIKAHRPKNNIANCEVDETRIGADGKTRKLPKRKPKSKPKSKPAEPTGEITSQPEDLLDDEPLPEAEEEEIEPDNAFPEQHKEPPKGSPPCFGLAHARAAIRNLQEIRKNDTERKKGFKLVKDWLNENE